MIVSSLEDNDVGDQTQRNYRYQNSYGLILLCAAARKDKPYKSIWCEFFEDILAESADGTFDAYQIKTRKPEEGLWQTFDEPFLGSIKKFVNLYNQFSTSIKNYYFVSNNNFPKSKQFINSNRKKYQNNPTALLEKVKCISRISDLDEPFLETFCKIRDQIACKDEELFWVLQKLDLILGPSRQDFDSVLSHDHLARLQECTFLNPTVLNKIRDDLVLKIYYASSLYSDDPNRHLISKFGDSANNHEIKSKRVNLESLYEIIKENKEIFEKNKEQKSIDSQVVFISHVSGKDTDFSKWLTFKLINIGYKVWCDLLHQEIGKENDAEAERIIKNNTCKFVFIISNNTHKNQKSLEQLQIAYDRMRLEGLDAFIIPIVIDEDHDEIFLIKKFSAIDFTTSWANGFTALIDTLPKDNSIRGKTSPSDSNQIWRSFCNPEDGIIVDNDEYVSNLFKVQSLPQTIKFHELKRNGGIGSIQITTSLPFPAFTHNIYLVSFANSIDFKGQLGNIDIARTFEIQTDEFLAGNFDTHLVLPSHARKFVIRLINLGWESTLLRSGLFTYHMSNGKLCHYYHKGLGEEMVPFIGINSKKSRRSLWGYKTVLKIGGEKTKKFWHYGISGKAISFKQIVICIKAHVLFSDDGSNIWNSTSRLHTARRSWCNNWWNPHWRDRLLAIMSFISNNQPYINLILGSTESAIVDSNPIIFTSPISYLHVEENFVEKLEEDDIEVLDLDLLDDSQSGVDGETYDE